jgi:hypothetical protein
MAARLPALAFGLLLSPMLAAADEPAQPVCTPGEVVPLGEADRRAITLEVVQRYPLAASSPGIKVANAWCSHTAAVSADVVFHPHTESAGIRYAFQIHCKLQLPERAWACERARLRRYVRLESQEFEVRVVGPLKIDEVLAVIEATRATARAAAASPADAEAANIVIPANGRYVVGWGRSNGMGGLTVEAELRDGGDPAVAADWLTWISVPEEE